MLPAAVCEALAGVAAAWPIDPLWTAHWVGRDPQARQALIEQHQPFARMMAAKAYGLRTLVELEFSDFLQLAMVGLVEAVDRFDPARGIRFQAYAARRIHGAILNGVCTMTEKQQQISARQELLRDRRESLKQRDAPTAGARALDYLADLAVGLALGFALEGTGMFADEERAAGPGPYDYLAVKQLKDVLRGLMRTLPARSREIVHMHYFQMRSFSEIADCLALSKGRVSQIHRESMEHLRSALREREPLQAWV